MRPTADLVTFTGEILDRKRHFFCAVTSLTIYHMLTIYPIMHVQLILLSFQYYITIFCSFIKKTEVSIYYCIWSNHKSSGFQKLAKNMGM